ncbi:redox-regulated ATPase YchF [Blattabacterium cuenoti]|uniref:redox-regulated ATPase YchF n=1 Tax=Blattabacterium cuenoti TaxID=1653831 RepID=UPI00163C017C|nr:redox-regulated ATPase YchF [Blattabacterium cuenoti]
MKCGIIGLPNIGKSTFFNIISNSKVLSQNFPFCTIEPNHGMVIVPDTRLNQLQKIHHSEKIIPSLIKIVDIAGLVKGSHKGEGLGNKFLSHIRETNVIIHMIRFFHDKSITHVENSIDPIRDKEIIDMELQLKDLETIEKKIKKIIKKNKNDQRIKILNNLLSFLKKGKNIRMYPFQEMEKKYVKKFQLLTEKPVIYIANVDEFQNKTFSYIKNMKILVEKEKSILITLPLKGRKNISHNIQKFIQKTHHLLSLQNFFTVGKKEIRSWSIPNPCTAYHASSVIHTDLQKGFIKAKIIHYNDYVTYQSEEKIKKLGKLLIVGKNYLIQDGDIIHFRFNQ